MINDRWGTETVDVMEGTPFALLAMTYGYDYDELAADLISSGACVSCDRNFYVEAPEALQASVPFYEGDLVSSDMVDQEALERIRVRQAHAVATGEGVTVAILDTGADFSHPDLSPFLSSEGYDFVSGDPIPQDELDGIDQDRDGLVDEAAGHGTHVTGIVHAVAPSATLLPVRVLDTGGIGNVFSVAKGIRHAASRGANVVNMSLGFAGHSIVMEYAIGEAFDSGVFLASSMGNQGVRTAKQFPANLAAVAAVAATDAWDLKASFSNYGEIVSMSAPGEGIISTYLFQGYAIWSGTSMAAPFVAGAGALALEIAPAASPDDVRAEIERAAAELDHAGYPYDGLMGAGRLDLWRLVLRGLPHDGRRPAPALPAALSE
jgi:subtilisin family serine protease